MGEHTLLVYATWFLISYVAWKVTDIHAELRDIHKHITGSEVCEEPRDADTD